MDNKIKDAPDPQAGNFKPSQRKRRRPKVVTRKRVAKPMAHVFHGTTRAPDQQATTKPAPLAKAKAMAKAWAREYRDTFSVFLGVELHCYYEQTEAGVKYRRPSRGEVADGQG